VSVCAMYKRKNQKVRSVNSCIFDDSISEESASWKADILKKELMRKIVNSTNQYAQWLILKFSDLTKSVRLKSERLQRMKIEDFLWEKKKNLLTKMLYNRKVVLA
jgi:hypothetical protein